MYKESLRRLTTFPVSRGVGVAAIMQLEGMKDFVKTKNYA